MPMHPYYTHNAYATNVIAIADASFSAHLLPPPTSEPMLSFHHTESLSEGSIYKKRKIERACDACRRRKTRCDGPRMPDNICTNCKQNRKSCSYVEASKPRGPPKAYINSLEDRLEKMESLLKRLRPDADFSEDLGPSVIRDSWKTDGEPSRHTSPHDKSTSPSVSSSRLKCSPLQSNAFPPSTTASRLTPNGFHTWRSARSPRSETDMSSDGYTSSDNEEVGELSLSRGVKRLTIRGLEPTQDYHSLTDNQVRFHGKSSFFKLIEPTRKLREEHVNSLVGGEDRSPSSRDSSSPVNAAALRRPEFWTTPPWELTFEGFPTRIEGRSFSLAEEFPPEDLADSLIRLYFEKVNPFIPLFHRPTFERQWEEGLQRKNTWFGCLCLSLFAVASRWSDDPRVLDDNKHAFPEAEGPINKNEWQRAGWRFFNVAVDAHRGSLSLFHPAGLFEVQTMALLGMFLRGTAFHPVAWLFISIGLRKAQDVGAHRKKIYGNKPTVDGELWKRAFWVLVLLDRMASTSLGRPCCSGEEDFDAELPLEVDDEFWETENPKKTFQQPSDTPSKIAAFNSHLKLTKIVAYAMRTIYALDRSKLLSSAARPRWQEVLSQLNHAMTEWVESVPRHLRWSPHIEDPLFSDQSATLYITYYWIQIIIYRPFLPPSLFSVMNITPHSNMPIPCIGICVNASKCVSRILKIQISRGYANIPHLILGSHVCAAILLMNFWDLKWQERNQMNSGALEDVKSPLAFAMAELLDEVSVCIEALETVKPRWRSAEMYLSELSSSLPHSLGGYEPSVSRDLPLSNYYAYAPEFDERDYCNAPPSDYPMLDNYPGSDYGIAPPINTYPYDAQAVPSENTHFFQFPHITRYPVPSSLPIPPSLDLGRFCAWPPQFATFRSRRDYDKPSTLAHSEPGDRRPSESTVNVHPRPGPLVDGRVMDESTVSNVDPDQTSLGWASDWDYNPVYAHGPSL